MTFGIDIGGHGVRLATPDGTWTLGPEDHRHSTARLADVVAGVGDRVPLVVVDEVGDVRSWPAHELFADLVQAGRRQLALRAGVEPDELGPGHAVVPSWWPRRARSLVRTALDRTGAHDVGLVDDAIAAVRGHDGELQPVVVVVDLGSHTCSVSILQGCDGDEPTYVSAPAVLSERGGAHLDALLLHHVLAQLEVTDLDPTNPVDVEAATRLLEQCRQAKEALAAETATTIAVDLPETQTQVRLVRSELDELLRPWARDVVALLRESLDSARTPIDQVLLVGGAARAPLVAQLISAELGLGVVKGPDPATTTVRGALRSTVAVPTKVARRGLLQRTRERRRARREQQQNRSTVSASALLELGSPSPVAELEPLSEEARADVAR